MQGKSLIFIHINKTAGTSFSKTLKRPRVYHFTLQDAISKLGADKVKKCITFAVVRNPWDKVLSHYYWLIKEDKHNFKSKHFLPFNEWVKKTYGSTIINKTWVKKPIMYAQQIQWIIDFENEIAVNEILRFEDLATSIQDFKDKYDLTFDIPHLNSTKKKNYKSYYNEESKEIIQSYFADDIKRFGYKF